MQDGIFFGFVPFPTIIWDETVDLSREEFRLLGYLLHFSTQRGNPEFLYLPDEELCNGFKNRNFERIDQGTGLTLEELQQARASLLERTWIEFQEYRAQGGYIVQRYSMPKIFPRESQPDDYYDDDEDMA